MVQFSWINLDRSYICQLHRYFYLMLIAICLPCPYRFILLRSQWELFDVLFVSQSQISPYSSSSFVRCIVFVAYIAYSTLVFRLMYCSTLPSSLRFWNSVFRTFQVSMHGYQSCSVIYLHLNPFCFKKGCVVGIYFVESTGCAFIRRIPL